MLILFSLVMARVFGLLLGAPALGRQDIPRRIQAALAVFLTVALLPAAGRPELPADAAALAGWFVREFAIGYAIGLFARLLITSFHLAASLISFQAGFAMAGAFDPESGVTTTVLVKIHVNLVTAILLLIDGHHLLIRTLASSFGSFPIGGDFASGPLVESLFASAGAMFEAGARIAAPVTGILLLVNATIGLLNRVMPQFSIFNIGFPLQVVAGLVATLVALPGDAFFFLRAWDVLEAQLAQLFLG